MHKIISIQNKYLSGMRKVLVTSEMLGKDSIKMSTEPFK